MKSSPQSIIKRRSWGIIVDSMRDDARQNSVYDGNFTIGLKLIDYKDQQWIAKNNCLIKLPAARR